MRKLWILMALIAVLCFGISSGSDRYIPSAEASGMSLVVASGSTPADEGGCAGGSDGAIGSSTNEGHTSISGGGSTVAAWSEYTPTEDGTVTYGHIVLSWISGTSTINIGIWNSSGTLLVDSSTQTVPGSGDNQQYDFALDSEYCLESGVTYRLGIVSSDTSFSVDRENTSGEGIWYEDDVTMGDSLGDTSTGTEAHSNYSMTIWFDNSAT
jgi:hypothetical protein